MVRLNEKYYKETRISSKLNSYLAQANKEYKDYRGSKNKNTTVLAEAGEKLWGAFNYYMELKTGGSLKTAEEVRKRVYANGDSTLVNLYEKAAFLHQFFYGWADRVEDVERRFNEVYKGLMFYTKNETV